MKIIGRLFNVVLLASAIAFAGPSMGDQLMLSDYQTQVDKFAQDDAGKLTPDDREAAIVMAVIRYSADRPDDRVEDVTSAGGSYLPLPVAWDDESSEVVAIEHPIGNVPPTYIGMGRLYRSPTGVQIGLPLGFTLQNGDEVRMTYSLPHTLDDNNDTIPRSDREAVASYAAAILLDQLATLYSGDSDSTIQADTVNHQSKSGEFSSRANKFRKRYHDHLGINAKKVAGASVVVNMDRTDSRGRGRFFYRG